MSPNVLLTSFFILFSSILLENSASKGESPSVCDLFQSTPVDYDTSSPLNVITKQAIKVNVNSTLTIETGRFLPLLVQNTGYIFEITTYPFERNMIKTYGGILCGKTYIFNKVGFFTSDDPEVSSFTQINGKGTPLTLSLVYYNAAYGSFEESLNYRDGLMIQNFQIGLTDADNPLFYPFQLIFNKFIEPGSKMILPADLQYAAFKGIFDFNDYFFYYGSYIDLNKNVQYPCAIATQATRTIYAISKFQFNNTFMKLKNIHGGKLISRQPVHQLGNRKLYKSDKGFYGKIDIF